MGTLGGDFLSSLPLHEYPPAFPLGADIQGMTWITVWGPGLPCPPPNQFRTLAPLQSVLAVLQRATIQGTSLNLCVVCDEVFRYEVDFNFSFPTRFRFIFFPSD